MSHLLTPGQEASVGVPNCLKMRKSSSISESPGKSGCRFTCHLLNFSVQFLYYPTISTKIQPKLQVSTAPV